MDLPREHFSLVTSQDITQICQPLFSTTPINYFIFARMYDSGSVIVFNTQPEWHRYFFEKDYARQINSRLKAGCHFWMSNMELSAANQDAKKYFNIDNKFELTERGKNYYDIFGFGSASGSVNVIDYYLNNMHVLKQFILYFKDKIKTLLDEAIKNKENQIFIPELRAINILPKSKENQTLKEFRQKTKHFFLSDDLNDVRLTRREIESLLHLLCGRTAQQISERLDISVKTVESYLSSIRAKLNCTSRAQLFRKAYDFGLIELAYNFDE